MRRARSRRSLVPPLPTATPTLHTQHTLAQFRLESADAWHPARPAVTAAATHTLCPPVVEAVDPSCSSPRALLDGMGGLLLTCGQRGRRRRSWRGQVEHRSRSREGAWGRLVATPFVERGSFAGSAHPYLPTYPPPAPCNGMVAPRSVPPLHPALPAQNDTISTVATNLDKVRLGGGLERPPGTRAWEGVVPRSRGVACPRHPLPSRGRAEKGALAFREGGD